MRTLKPNLLDQLRVQRLWLGLQKVRGQQRSPAVQTVLPSTDVPLCSVGGRKFRAAHCFNRKEEEERGASLAALCLIEFTFDFNSRSGIFSAGNGVPQAAGGIQQRPSRPLV